MFEPVSSDRRENQAQEENIRKIRTNPGFLHGLLPPSFKIPAKHPSVWDYKLCNKMVRGSYFMQVVVKYIYIQGWAYEVTAVWILVLSLSTPSTVAPFSPPCRRIFHWCWTWVRWTRMWASQAAASPPCPSDHVSALYYTCDMQTSRTHTGHLDRV